MASKSAIHYVRALSPSLSTRKQIQFSHVDNVFQKLFRTVYFVFENDSQKTNFMPPSKLRHSLALALNEFPEFAGTAVQKTGIWGLNADNKGVKFIENEADVSLATLKHRQFVQHALPDEMLIDPIDDAENFARPLVIKHTKLTDGSVLLTIAQNHVVADAFSIFNLFFPKWLAHHHKIAEKLPKQPFTDRSILIGDADGPKDACGWHDQNSHIFNAKLHFHDPTNEFNMSAAQVQALKEDIQMKIGDQFKVTANDAICALAWAVNTKVLESEPPPAGSTAQDLEYTIFEQILNGRRLLKLPQNYFGNAIFCVSAKAKQSDLLGVDGLAIGARALHKSVRGTTPEELRHWLNWMADGKFPDKFRRPAALADKGCSSTNVMGLGYQSLNFGDGPPIHFGLTEKSFRRSSYAIFSAVENELQPPGGARIVFALPESAQTKFWAHPLVMKYVTMEDQELKMARL